MSKNPVRVKQKYMLSTIISAAIVIMTVLGIYVINFAGQEGDYTATRGTLDLRDWDPAKKKCSIEWHLGILPRSIFGSRELP